MEFVAMGLLLLASYGYLIWELTRTGKQNTALHQQLEDMRRERSSHRREVEQLHALLKDRPRLEFPVLNQQSDLDKMLGRRRTDQAAPTGKPLDWEENHA